ncbi:hypothetical protein V8F20_008187 [Naviculisporaceae sp. PSN 640]
MSTPKIGWTTQLPFSLTLSALDYLAPPIYTRLVYGFQFEHDSVESKNEAIADIEQSLRITFSHWPFLAGQVHHPTGGKPIKLLYGADPGLWNINQKKFTREVFHSQDLTSQSNHASRARFPWSFSQLLGPNGDAQPARLDKDILSLSPEHAHWTKQEWYHPVTLLATFIDQGLLLCFSIHHGIMDGASLTQFLRCFSREGQYRDMGTFDHQVRFRTEDIRRSIAPRYAYFHEANTLNALKSTYDFRATQLTPPPKSTCVAKILTFTSHAIQSLNDQANAVLRESSWWGSSNASLTSADVISGLVWLHVTRARLHRLRDHPNKITKFATTVDLRSYLHGILPADIYASLSSPSDYIGNMYLRIMATTTVSELVQEAMDDQRPNRPAKIETITYAAWLIRKEIMRLRRSHDNTLFGHVGHHLSLMHQALKPKEEQRQQMPTPTRTYSASSLAAASTRALQNNDTGLDCSSWLSMGGDTQFEIRGIRNDFEQAPSPGPGKCRPR